MSGMALPAIRSRRARRWVAAAFAMVLPLADALAAGSPIPELRRAPSPRPRVDQPMRIVRVTSSDPACAPDCPEWISAEGAIRPGTSAAFARVVAGLNGRRLPVLISSRGGALRDALEMGALIRSKGLPVAVARTLFKNCPPGEADCSVTHGQAIVGGASCASACPLVLAGGLERLIGPTPLVGVHQITTVMTEADGAVGLTKSVKVYEQPWVDQTVANYLTSMGVGEPVMTLVRKTPAASIRWLSLDEIEASGLANGALDPAEPIVTQGANGLSGRAFGETDAVSGLTAKLVADGVSLSLTYRQGGGALQMALSAADGRAPADPAGWSVTAGGAPIVLSTDAAGASTALLPRDRFCALAPDDRVVATPQTASAARRPLVLDLGGADAQAIRTQACP